MRLRCLSIDYFEEASKQSAQKHANDQIPLPDMEDKLISLLSLPWTMPELLKTVSPVVNCQSSTLGCFDISKTQSQFLFSVLPVRLPKPCNPCHNAFVMECIERVMDKSSHLHLHEFEVVELDTHIQQDAIMSELWGLANTRRNNHISDVHKLLSYNQESSHFRKICRDLTHTEVSYSKPLKTSALGSDIHLTSRDDITSRLLVLEVAEVDEILFSSNMTEFCLNVKEMMFDLLETMDHQQLGDFTSPLESYLMDLSSKIFTTTFNLHSSSREKPEWKSAFALLEYQDATETLHLGPATKNEQNWFLFELPVCYTDKVAHCSFKKLLLSEIRPPQQILIPIKNLDFTCPDQYEALVVVPELVLSDSTFSSLPVPTFKEKDKYCSAVNLMHEVLLPCKHYMLCALNFLYLDWHFSHGTDCGKPTCCKLENIISEIATYEYIQYVIRVDEDTHNSVMNQIENNLEIKHSNEKESLVCSPKHSISFESRESACSAVMADKPELLGEGRFKTETIPEIVPRSLGSSILSPLESQSNPGGIFACDDLALFMQARQGVLNTPIRSNTVKKVPDLCEAHKNVNLEQKKINSCDASGETKEHNLNVHNIPLSEPIIKLRQMLELDYKRIINDDHDLAFHIKDHSVLQKLNTETDAKNLLIMLIEQQVTKQEVPQDQKLLRSLIALYILQRAAENLCTYGIQVGHLYMESWYMNLQFLQDLICFSYAELEEAYKQVEKGLLLDHPKLKYLVNIIESHKVQAVKPKFLVVAERRALFTLYKQIISCNLRPYQFDRDGNLLQDVNLLSNSEVLENAVVDALSKCDCLMVPPEYISLVFPVKQFTCILQYGDLSASLQCKIFRCDAEVHCLQVAISKPTDSSEALSRMAEQETFCKDRASGSGENTIRNSMNSLGDIEVSCESHNKPKTKEAGTIKSADTPQDKQLTPVSSPVTSKLIGKQEHSYKQCKMNIVANISLAYNHLLNSRRSSYQKIIALENDGFCVVERDLLLPIDLILTPSICVILYTEEKVFENRVMLDTAAQLAWVEHITDNVMKPLSFSYNTCIMIFEGPYNFLQEALQAFGSLYVAAIVLDIQLQCFISGGPLLTDAILKKCILSVKSMTKDVSFPAMLEAKTYVESFLNMFASINPLTAHAILSGGGGLKPFLCLEIEDQLKLTESFGLSENSLNLFKLQVHSGSLRDGIKHGQGKISRKLDNAKEKYQNETKGFVFPRSGLDIDGDTPVLKKQRIDLDALPDSNRMSRNEFSASRVNHNRMSCEEPAVVSNSQGIDLDALPDSNRMSRNEFSASRVNFNRMSSEEPAVVGNSQDAKLRRTIDLMLKRNRQKETGYSSTQSHVMDYRSSPYIHYDRSLQEEHCYFEETCKFNPNLEHEHMSSVKPAMLNPNFNSPVDVQDRWGSSKTADRHKESLNSPVYVDNQWDFSKPGDPFSPNSAFTKEWDVLGNNRSNDHTENLLCQTGENIDSLFEWNVADDFSESNEKKLSSDFMNETRAHLKRKLGFEFPNAEKHFTKKPREWQAQRKLDFLDSYKFKKSESERLNGYDLARNQRSTVEQECPRKSSQDHVKSRGRPSIYGRRRVTASTTSRKVKENKGSIDTSQSRKLQPSWTPVDKRSEKVLSFARKGNDSQSRLVWASY